MLFTEFVSTYGTTILYTILSAALSALGVWIGKIYKEKCNDDTKRKVVKTCCKAVKQLYHDLDGAAKYDKAVEAIVEMLAEKGITITDLEIKMLIEEVCDDFHDAVKGEIEKPEPVPEIPAEIAEPEQEEGEPDESIRD